MRRSQLRLELQLQSQIVHQRRYGARRARQPLETRRQQDAVAVLQFRQTRITQPVLHAVQGVQQVTQLPSDPVAARTQTQVADRSLHPFRLQQGFARLRQDELLLLWIGAT